MLEMRPNCEICDQDLPADMAGAKVCSFECTFCASCVGDVCPNCGGDIQDRPMRAGAALEKFPASTIRVVKSK